MDDAGRVGISPGPGSVNNACAVKRALKIAGNPASLVMLLMIAMISSFISPVLQGMNWLGSLWKKPRSVWSFNEQTPYENVATIPWEWEHHMT